MIFLSCRDLEQLAPTTGGNDVDSVISNDSLDKYEQRMNADECDMNPKEEKRRSSHFFCLNSIKIYEEILFRQIRTAFSVLIIGNNGILKIPNVCNTKHPVKDQKE